MPPTSAVPLTATPRGPPVSNVRAHEIGELIDLVNHGRLGEAEARTSSMLRVQPADGTLWKILSVALLRQDKDALLALQRAAELLPQDAEVQANLGAELRARGEWEAASVSLRRALELQPHNPETLIDAADTQQSLGRTKDAVELYRHALQLDPDRSDAHNNLGNALLALGEVTAAADCYRRALRLRPQNAQVLCNLGNASRQLGEFEEAIVCTRRALELAPGLSMAHNNLGLLLMARDEWDAAIASYHEAIRHNPRYVEAFGNLGTALRHLGRKREALSALQQALELDPNRADSHVKIGRALIDSRRIQQALDSFRNALGLQPNHIAAHLGLSTAQRLLGLSSEAEASCERALGLSPQGADALVLLGELRADRGQFSLAQELFERALAVDPTFTPAYCSIAAHRHMTRDDTAWLQGVQNLLTSQLPLDDEQQLNYALGKYFDDVADYDQAFTRYQRANELNKRYGGRYDETNLTTLVGRIIDLCNVDFLRTISTAASTSAAQTTPVGRPAPGAARTSEAPVFIIGMPRSGTSLTEQILVSHPAVSGAGEIAFWDKAFSSLEGSASRSEPLEPIVAAIAQEYLQRVHRRADEAMRVTDKMPANFFYLGLIHAALPRSRIIHLQRHPLDTCISVYFQNFFHDSPYANDLHRLAHYYGQYQRIMDHWRSVLPAGTLLEVPYEGLVADPEVWTRRMLEFVGLPWDPRCLQFNRAERAVITASKWQVRQKINSSSVERWRHYAKYLAPLRHLAPDQYSN
jgi:tetratricopeptide (TPR) repeat protein